MQSTFADDPEMRDILNRFVGSLGGRIAAMQAALAGGDDEELRRLAHRLKGEGGSFGYPALTDAARRLEEAVTAQDQAKATSAIDRLAVLVQAIREAHDEVPTENIS